MVARANTARAPITPPRMVSPTPASMMRCLTPASAWYVSTVATAQITPFASAEPSSADSALKDSYEARLLSSAQSKRKLAKNIRTPVTRWVIEA